jgi:hypothetical protein
VRLIWIPAVLCIAAMSGCREGGEPKGASCHARVLILSDDASGAAPLAVRLAAAGFAVSTTSTPVSDYDGAHPPLTGFDAVLLLPGAQQASVHPDMPAEGQQALMDFVNAGHGLVLTEWAAYHIAAQPAPRWLQLKPLVLLHRQASFSGQVTWQVEPAFAHHPIWAGLPASFTFSSVSNVGATVPGPGVSRVASSPQALDAVALRDLRGGRVVHLAHAGTYVLGGWMNDNLQQVVSNAVGWVSRCR